MSRYSEYTKEWRRLKLIEDPTYRQREHKKYRATHKEELITKSKIRRSNPKFILYSKSYARERTKNLRYQVLSHYSKSEQPYCIKCGFNDIRALNLDHINNDGAQERKLRKAQTLLLYLISNNYPNGYQVLCSNCNQIKEMDRRCK